VLLYSLDGRCQATYSAYEMALGVKSVSWSSTSQFLAVGSYDEKVHYLNTVDLSVNNYLSTACIVSFDFSLTEF